MRGDVSFEGVNLSYREHHSILIMLVTDETVDDDLLDEFNDQIKKLEKQNEAGLAKRMKEKLSAEKKAKQVTLFHAFGQSNKK